MRRMVSGLGVIALTVAAGCSHHATTPDATRSHHSLGRCEVGGSPLEVGSTRDGERCVSLRWRVEGQSAQAAKIIHITWFGNCLDAAAKAHWKETANSVSIAVSVPETFPPPDTGCPSLDGHSTVRLRQRLGGRALVHTAVSDS